MWSSLSHGSTWTLYASCILWQVVTGNPTLSTRNCHGNPYCEDDEGEVRWHNDCGIERPSQKVFAQYKSEDVPWFRGQLNQYLDEKRHGKLDRDEKSWPSWMAKRFSPDHPPSSMVCDGLGSCIVCIHSSKLLARSVLSKSGAELQGYWSETHS
jgi:hypothetical protein